MTLTKEQQKLLLGASIAVIVLVNGYRLLTAEAPRTVPLKYERGAVASAPVRPGVQDGGGAVDPLRIFLERSAEPYPGVVRDIFRMENPAARQRSKPALTVVETVPSPPPVPERTPEETAADIARADLAKFRYLGYLTEKDSTIFLSKDGELFIVKTGGMVLNNYKVKEAYKDFVVILDTVTRVERRVDLSGDGTQQQQPLQQPQPQRPQPPAQPRPLQLDQPPKQQPAEQSAQQPAPPIPPRRQRNVRPQ